MDKDIAKLIKCPHRLGWMLGYEQLTEEHSKWIRKFWLNDQDYVIQAHRNSYKTTALIIVGNIWYQLQYPEDTVLLIREESKNAERTLKTIRNHLYTDCMRYIYEELFGIKNFDLLKDNADSMVLPTKEQIGIEGSLDAIGIGTSLTGRHYNRIIADDIITVKDRISKAARDHKKLFIMELENIKTANALLSVSGTPWHREDAFSILPEPDRYPLGTIKIKDLTADKIERIRRRTSASLFAANYMLKHIADKDKIFSDVKYENYNKEWKPFGVLDPAYSGTNTTALSLFYHMDNKVIVKGWIWEEDVSDLYVKIKEILTNHNYTTLYIEKNADKGLSHQAFQKLGVTSQSYHESENKHQRIISYAKYYWDMIYFTNDCQSEYISQILDYEEGQDPDDAIDSLTGGIRRLKDQLRYEDELESTSIGNVETFALEYS